MGELKTYGQPNVVIALAANKCDLEDYRVVSKQEGKAYAHEQEMAYFETSAKTAHNVRQMFVELGAPPAGSECSISLCSAPAGQRKRCKEGTAWDRATELRGHLQR